MVKRILVAVSIVLFLFVLIMVQPAESKEVRLPKGTLVTLRLPDDVDSITDINVPLDIKVDRDVVIDGKVVIKSGTPAIGRAHRVEHPVEISVQSTKAVDRQNVRLDMRGEPMGTRVDVYTTSDVRVNVPAVSKEARLPRGTPVMLRLSGDAFSITNTNMPLTIEVDRDVVIDGKVVIKSGTPVMGKASMLESPVMLGPQGKMQISVQSTETVDRQNVGLMVRGEPMGTRVDTYTTDDMRVNVPAVSEEALLPKGTLVTLRLSDDIDSITDVDKPFTIEVDRDVVIDGKVVIKSGTPVTGMVSMVEHPVEISVQSTETIDRQNVRLNMRGEPMGTRVDTYNSEDILVNAP